VTENDRGGAGFLFREMEGTGAGESVELDESAELDAVLESDRAGLAAAELDDVLKSDRAGLAGPPDVLESDCAGLARSPSSSEDVSSITLVAFALPFALEDGYDTFLFVFSAICCRTCFLTSGRSWR
jgi:hypothetical protein